VSIKALRILPPLAIGRLGSAPDPVDNFTMEDNEEHPLGFRRIVPQETLTIDPRTGAISGTHTPSDITFKDGDHIRPVAPFLEVFARVDRSRTWQPLTLNLLAAHGHTVKDLSWQVTVANRKVERRTGDREDAVAASTGPFSHHDPQPLRGHSPNFISKSRFIDFGSVRFIKPTRAYPEIRFRFMPAKGYIYGPKLSEAEQEALLAENPDMYVVPESRQLYDTRKGTWYKFTPPEGIDNPEPDYDGPFSNETLPPSLYAIIPPAPPWLNHNLAISRGYFDDACDGIVEVTLNGAKGEAPLTAAARITAGPPMAVPDSLFVRNLCDDLDQVIFGPRIEDEPIEETRARAEDIIRRAFETVRFLNVAVMNGNPVNARDPLDIDTMPAEEAFDVLRPMRPVFGEKTADTLAIMRLHQQVYATLRAGAAPWFPALLRKPDEVTDFTDNGRRKMPALMCGADGNYLALTHRQIDTIYKAAGQPPGLEDLPVRSALSPRNLAARRHEEINFVARGNPVSTRPVSSVANCTPGLEVDLRAVWRRVFEGIVLREYDNLVVDVTDPALAHLKGCRLLRISYGDEKPFFTMAQAVGPSPADTVMQSVVYATDANPTGLAPLEWSNALAKMLHARVGQTVTCDFTTTPSWYGQQPWNDKDDHATHALTVRPFFEDDTAVISRVLAEAGELTQGLCSPWQNDYRECSCYYWASARPDFVNVEPTSTGASAGDNWLQKDRTGDYVPDDYVDSRLVLYDDLFKDWEKWLRFAIGGRDDTGRDNG
jgi:hypothetical protein